MPRITFSTKYKVVMYIFITSCHGAAIVMLVCAIVTSDTMVACTATFFCETIVQFVITILAP